MSDESDFQVSDDELDDTKHEEIVENVLNLNKTKRLKKPLRTEPSLKITEFNLVKSVANKKGHVELDSLTKALKGRKKHENIGKKLEFARKKAKTLPKPLEKPQADRIRRSIAYERSRFEFDRWEALVASNRAAAHQTFPLRSVEKIRLEEREAVTYPQSFIIKSDIQKELEKLEPQVKNNPNKEKALPVTLKELKEQRREMAKLRAHQSYKEAKARKQNKIKSKKYHRILRKEKIKKKLQEFEELQKSDPEEALKKLQEIERVRALERFNLRHRSTGQWAKSKQFRAKYDKESRQMLSNQLAISRDLTHKLKNQNSDSEDDYYEDKEGNSNVITESESSPWLNGPKPNKELNEFYTNYKKFWTEQNSMLKSAQEENKVETERIDSTIKETTNEEENDNTENQLETNETISTNQPKNKKAIKCSKKKAKSKITNGPKLKTETTSKKSKLSILDKSSGDWDIEQLFDKAEKKLAKKLQKGVRGVQKKKQNRSILNKKPKVKNIKKKKIDLSMPPQSKKHVIDEEMIERPKRHEDDVENENNDLVKLRNILEAPVRGYAENISPEKFLKPKTVELNSALPDFIESNETNDQKTMIEAFEDIALEQDFTSEKTTEIDKDKPKDIDLNLPGWGSWAGAMIDPSKRRKRRRFIVKMPKALPRRDDNKGSVIIYEKAESKIKPLLVSEVPFPYKTVKDFEASIRAPIGDTFVPETAFQKFIKPAVETKMGAIIKPITKSILMGKK